MREGQPAGHLAKGAFLFASWPLQRLGRLRFRPFQGLSRVLVWVSKMAELGGTSQARSKEASFLGWGGGSWVPFFVPLWPRALGFGLFADRTGACLPPPASSIVEPQKCCPRWTDLHAILPHLATTCCLASFRPMPIRSKIVYHQTIPNCPQKTNGDGVPNSPSCITQANESQVLPSLTTQFRKLCSLKPQRVQKLDVLGRAR